MKKILGTAAVLALIIMIFASERVHSAPPHNRQTTNTQAARGSQLPRSRVGTTTAQAENAYGVLPMYFEKNQGQTDSQVQFLARGGGYTVFLTPTEAVFSLTPTQTNYSKVARREKMLIGKRAKQSTRRSSVLRMKLSGGNLAPNLEGVQRLPGVVNYLIGRDPSKWHINVPTFESVQVSSVYPGIDMVYYGNSRRLEYDFVVKQGADPRQIAFEFEGADAVSLGQIGAVDIASPAGRLTMPKPSIYQLEKGKRKPIEGNFVLREGHKVGVDVKSYDHSKPLVIDPVLAYSTYIGGSSQDVSDAIAVDSQGFAYIAGYTDSPDFPTVGTSLSAAPSGSTLAFVSKLNQAGTGLVYSTFLGGTTFDAAYAIAVDGNSQPYVVGVTDSSNFPVTPGNAFQTALGVGATSNAFLSKLTSDGQFLLYSTFLGGTADDEAWGVAVDSQQNAYLAGYASSPNFPVTSNAFQNSLNSPNGNAFVTRVDTTQAGASSLVYSTFVGGSSPYSFNDLNSGTFGGDGALGIAIDAKQNAYIVGEASSTDFPITSSTAYQTTGNANNSAFLTRLDTNKSGSASFIYSTFLGGTGTNGDLGEAISLDPSANAYITGCAFSPDFPVTTGNGTAPNPSFGKAFTAKFNTNMSGAGSLGYSAVVGGSGGDCAYAVVVDPDGNAYVGGVTSSSDFPVTSNAVQSTLQSSNAANGFIFALSPDGSNLLYSTYFGGSGSTFGDYVDGVVMDSATNLYFTGQTDSTDLPTTTGAFQTSLDGALSAFVAKLTGIVTTAQISSIIPGSGPVGTTVTISGGNFGSTQGTSTITFNGTTASPSSWSATSIVVPVPSGSTSGTVAVNVGGTSSNAANFAVLPSLTSIAITLSNTSLTSGMTEQLVATGVFADGSTTDVTSTVNWSSGASQVAAVNSSGLLRALSAGTTTITGSLGTLSGSATLTVTFWAPSIMSVSPNSGPAGTQVTITGSGFGNTQGSGSVVLGTNPGLVSSWTDTQVVATIATGSVSGIAQILQMGAVSNSFSFTVNTPTVTNVSPTSGVAGTQVTVTGSGFGSTQNSGQVWLGTAIGQVSNWSDGQVVATVVSGSTSGNAQILQNGVWSNSVPFTVNGVLHVASISPNTGGAGTVVTIQGSGFGSLQGGGSILIGTVNASVTSWSDTQISATVGAGAVTGVAKVEQNGTWSNAVSFVIPSSSALLVPSVVSMVVGDTHAIQSLNSSGQAVTGLTWTSSDTTIATLSTDDPPVITAVAPGNVTITAGGATADVTVYAGPTLPLGTVIWSNPGDGSGVGTFYPAVPSPTGVADVFAEQNDGSIEALTSDGIVAWASSVGGFGNSYIPDFQGGLLVFGSGTSSHSDTSIYKLDGLTGQPYPAYTTTTNEGMANGLEYPVIHTDGTILTVDYACDTDCPWNPDDTDGAWVVGIDPSTGSAKFKVAMANSTTQSHIADSWCGDSPGSSTTYAHSWPYSLIIAGDGYIYTAYTTSDYISSEKKSATQPWPDVAYQYFAQLQQDTGSNNFSAALGDFGSLAQVMGWDPNPDDSPLGIALENNDAAVAVELEQNLQINTFRRMCDSSQSSVTKLHVLRVGTDGSSSDVVVYEWDWTQNGVYAPTPSDRYNSTLTTSAPGADFNGLNLITNADTGVVFSWQVQKWAYCTVQTDSGCSGQVNTVIENHLATATGSAVTSDFIMSTNNGNPSPGYPVVPVLQLADGSFVGTVLTQTGNSMVAFDSSGNVKWTVASDSPQIATADSSIIAYSGNTYDANGNATGQLPNLPTYSWLDNAYQSGSVDMIAAFPLYYASTFGALASGNNSGNGTAILQQWFPPLQSCYDTALKPQPVCPGPKEAINDALKSLRFLLAGPCPSCSQYVFTTSNIPKLNSNQSQFSQFISQPPFFFDGTRSKLRMDYFQCGGPWWLHPGCIVGSDINIPDYMVQDQATAVSQTPSQYGKIVTAFDPSAICGVWATSPQGVLNQALLFHEALHGKSGLQDKLLPPVPSLFLIFNIDFSFSTNQVTYYLEDNVLGGGASKCGN